MRGKSTAPKDALINLILNSLPEEYIRIGLNIKQNGNLVSQISNQNKSTLVDLLNNSEDGAQLLARLEDKYPLSGAPTLYLVISRHLASIEQILEKTDDIANNDDCVLSFPSAKTIRCVYSTERARSLKFRTGYY